MVQIEYDDVVPVLPAKSTTNNNNSFLDRLHRVEKHLRKNKLKLTLTERLGAANKADEVSSQDEAKKLAFYLFWNCKTSFERCARVAGSHIFLHAAGPTSLGGLNQQR